MKKNRKTILFTLGLTVITSVSVLAAKGLPVQGQSGGGTAYEGYVEGSADLYNCYGATTTIKLKGSEDVYAYVEIVNAEGYKIGNGTANIGKDKAYSGTVTRSGGKNAYGSVGTASGSSRAFASLYRK